VRAELRELSQKLSTVTAEHRTELARRDELMSNYTAEITTLNDKLNRSQQQVEMSLLGRLPKPVSVSVRLSIRLQKVFLIERNSVFW